VLKIYGVPISVHTRKVAQLESGGTLSADHVVVRAEPMCRLLSLRGTEPFFRRAGARTAASKG